MRDWWKGCCHWAKPNLGTQSFLSLSSSNVWNKWVERQGSRIKVIKFPLVTGLTRYGAPSKSDLHGTFSNLWSLSNILSFLHLFISYFSPHWFLILSIWNYIPLVSAFFFSQGHWQIYILLLLLFKLFFSPFFYSFLIVSILQETFRNIMNDHFPDN